MGASNLAKAPLLPSCALAILGAVLFALRSLCSVARVETRKVGIQDVARKALTGDARNEARTCVTTDFLDASLVDVSPLTCLRPSRREVEDGPTRITNKELPAAMIAASLHHFTRTRELLAKRIQPHFFLADQSQHSFLASQVLPCVTHKSINSSGYRHTSIISPQRQQHQHQPSPMTAANNPPTVPFGIVSAMANNRVIGIDGDLPWSIPHEYAIYRRLTTNNIIILGRRTFLESESQEHIGHASHCIIVSRTMKKAPVSKFPTKLEVAGSLEAALERAKELATSKLNDNADANSIDVPPKCWIVGGECIYTKAVQNEAVTHVYLSIVDTEVDLTSPSPKTGKLPEAVARFPDKSVWEKSFKEMSNTVYPPEDGAPGFTHYVYTRSSQ